MRVLVDADACPRDALAVMRRLQPSYGFELITFANVHHEIEGEHHVVVSDGPQAVDIALANRARRGDLVVTQDWGLAALVLGRGCLALAPSGHRFLPERMDFMLEEREAKAKFRRAGGRTRGPKARSTADTERFQAEFQRLLDEHDAGSTS